MDSVVSSKVELAVSFVVDSDLVGTFLSTDALKYFLFDVMERLPTDFHPATVDVSISFRVSPRQRRLSSTSQPILVTYDLEWLASVPIAVSEHAASSPDVVAALVADSVDTVNDAVDRLSSKIDEFVDFMEGSTDEALTEFSKFVTTQLPDTASLDAVVSDLSADVPQSAPAVVPQEALDIMTEVEARGASLSVAWIVVLSVFSAILLVLVVGLFVRRCRPRLRPRTARDIGHNSMTRQSSFAWIGFGPASSKNRVVTTNAADNRRSIRQPVRSAFIGQSPMHTRGEKPKATHQFTLRSVLPDASSVPGQDTNASTVVNPIYLQRLNHYRGDVKIGSAPTSDEANKDHDGFTDDSMASRSLAENAHQDNTRTTVEPAFVKRPKHDRRSIEHSVVVVQDSRDPSPRSTSPVSTTASSHADTPPIDTNTRDKRTAGRSEDTKSEEGYGQAQDMDMGPQMRPRPKSFMPRTGKSDPRGLAFAALLGVTTRGGAVGTDYTGATKTGQARLHSVAISSLPSQTSHKRPSALFKPTILAPIVDSTTAPTAVDPVASVTPIMSLNNEGFALSTPDEFSHTPDTASVTSGRGSVAHTITHIEDPTSDGSLPDIAIEIDETAPHTAASPDSPSASSTVSMASLAASLASLDVPDTSSILSQSVEAAADVATHTQHLSQGTTPTDTHSPIASHMQSRVPSRVPSRVHSTVSSRAPSLAGSLVGSRRGSRDDLMNETTPSESGSRTSSDAQVPGTFNARPTEETMLHAPVPSKIVRAPGTDSRTRRDSIFTPAPVAVQQVGTPITARSTLAQKYLSNALKRQSIATGEGKELPPQPGPVSVMDNMVLTEASDSDHDEKDNSHNLSSSGLVAQRLALFQRQSEAHK